MFSLQASFWMLDSIISCTVPGWWPTLLLQHQHFRPHGSISVWLFSLNHASVLQHFFWLLLWEPKRTPHPSVLFFNHHSASGGLPSRKGSPLPGLPPNPSAACPSARHAAHSPVLPTTCRSTPCHSSPLSCGNIRHHCQPVPACVAKITLSRTLGVQVTSVAISVFNVWSCDDRQAPFRRWSLPYKFPW